eukprot:INCI3291.1.p1 GENE.INCI3291.1~~INCI3291.1.p1  ORF type:complete len:694 (-),score=135.42 INCI3291.1:278-2359(-)
MCPPSLPRGFALIYEPLCFTPCLVQELVMSPGIRTADRNADFLGKPPVELKECYRGLPMHHRRQIVHQVLNAVAHAHAHGVVHRDIKLANIIVTGVHHTSRVQGEVCACVIDWGLAVQLDRHPPKHLSFRVGTAGYKDPICALAEAAGTGPNVEAEADAALPASDVWAVGVVAATLLHDLPKIPTPATAAISAAEFVRRIVENVTGPRDLRSFMRRLVARRCADASAQLENMITCFALPQQAVCETAKADALALKQATDRVGRLLLAHLQLKRSASHNSPVALEVEAPHNSTTGSRAAAAATEKRFGERCARLLRKANAVLVHSQSYADARQQRVNDAIAAAGAVDRTRNSVPTTELHRVVSEVLQVLQDMDVATASTNTPGESAASQLLTAVATLVHLGMSKRFANLRTLQAASYGNRGYDPRFSWSVGDIASYAKLFKCFERLLTLCIDVSDRVVDHSTSTSTPADTEGGGGAGMASTTQALQRELEDVVHAQGLIRSLYPNLLQPARRQSHDFVLTEAEAVSVTLREFETFVDDRLRLQALLAVGAGTAAGEDADVVDSAAKIAECVAQLRVVDGHAEESGTDDCWGLAHIADHFTASKIGMLLGAPGGDEKPGRVPDEAANDGDDECLSSSDSGGGGDGDGGGGGYATPPVLLERRSDPAVQAFLRKCLCWDPQSRASAAELAKDPLFR